jgi:hypothetical protein
LLRAAVWREPVQHSDGRYTQQLSLVTRIQDVDH